VGMAARMYCFVHICLYQRFTKQLTSICQHVTGHLTPCDPDRYPAGVGVWRGWIKTSRPCSKEPQGFDRTHNSELGWGHGETGRISGGDCFTNMFTPFHQHSPTCHLTFVKRFTTQFTNILLPIWSPCFHTLFE
jgi:hypothetical protein